MTIADVSGETQDEAEVAMYGQLIEWSAWATGRKRIELRLDDVAGAFRITAKLRDRVDQVRKSDMTPRLEAIEKAVAGLKRHDQLLHQATIDYFLDAKTVARIAAERTISEHHVVGFLQRALRILAKTVPQIEAGLTRGAGIVGNH